MSTHVPTVALTVEQLWQPVPGGSGTYVRELVAALGAGTHARVVGLAARGHGTVPDAPDDGSAVPVATSHLPRTAMYELWHRWRGGPLPRGAHDVDVVHATTWAVPPRRAPLVVTVHDLAFLRTPEHFTARGVAFFRRALEIVRAEADAVVVPSRTTADDCVRHGIDAARVHVVPHGVRVPTVGPDQVAELHARVGLVRPYLLWCGTLEPRKNLAGLVRAWAAALDDGLDLDLALVGPAGWGEAAADVERALAGAPAERLHLLGRLDDADLHAAYAGARAFCFPSWWEGFGMPVLEAMAHGVPVVTSAGTSMAEFVGDGGVLVDPGDVDAISRALLTVAGPAHAELAAGALAGSTGRTWDHAASATAAVYGEVAR
ncbi:glycosyltransferase family 4 protein [Cellulomonas oligotrophica]|uniref:Glycosyl transferase n=1 Tax=Cellulomonas oligotrophica TaxID=931536 RepID=A0A7Y9FDK0_9CELL|nr:glycosyltransferase family 1 protein [Cellulomonas oligotrophica]NYD85229.1 glycosyltransferase involved in cell wall biosynthesis [Cellulomonas oligotrophica]GIG33335.1 glycosyl transferase [Cellulomonas oligotrophica]